MSDRVAAIDYATWLTKAQAAAAMGVTPKTVERFVDDGKIQKAYWQPGGRGPTRVVYEPEDVAKLAAARQPGPLPPFLVPTPKDRSTNGNGRSSTALAQTSEPSNDLLLPGNDLLRALVTAAVRVMSETSETSTLFLTIAEAAAASGLSKAYLKRQCEAKTLKAIQDGRRWKIKRTDVEAL